MVHIALIGITAVMKVLLCKLLAFGFFLLVFYIKGKQLHFYSEQWDEYFLTLSAKKLDCFVITTYLVAAVLSSFAGYGLLRWLHIPYAGFIAAAFFLVGVAISGFKYGRNKRAYIQERYAEIPQIILQRRKDAEYEER